MELVFVYGTLKRGFPNHHLLPAARFVGEVGTRLRYPLVVAGRWFSPTLVAEAGDGHNVQGELYEVDDAGLRALDRLEGVGLPLGYDRIAIEVVGANGAEPLNAWAYVKPRSRIGQVHSEPLEAYRLDPRYVPGDRRV